MPFSSSKDGLINEKGYDEQAQSYKNMQAAAGIAACAESKSATGDFIAAGIQGLTAISTFRSKAFPIL